MKLQRYSIYGFCSPQPTDSDNGNWCDGDDVAELEKSRAELLEVAIRIKNLMDRHMTGEHMSPCDEIRDWNDIHYMAEVSINNVK